MEDKDVTRLHARIDKLSSEFDESKGDLSEKLNVLHGDIKVLLTTCKQRGQTCHHNLVQLDHTVRGNGGEGLVSRMNILENTKNDREKYSYLIIGCISTACVALLVKMVLQAF
jgi:hypothetical protein